MLFFGEGVICCFLICFIWVEGEDDFVGIGCVGICDVVEYLVDDFDVIYFEVCVVGCDCGGDVCEVVGYDVCVVFDDYDLFVFCDVVVG